MRCAGALQKRGRVIWCWHKEPYMFVEEGVYVMAPNFYRAEYKMIVWTLIDSDQSKDGIPDQFIDHNMPFFVIYATSPARERWSRLHKSYTLEVVVMNPWTRGEIYRA
ncbi:hypothetical protein F5888DRAFT_714950 [Russula emetica]|nr:hypothetical protein F5888DRAFT_714950 [Russula emetica]